MAFIKKVLIVGLLLFMPALGLAQSPPTKKLKVLVVYYSREGHTKLAAEALARRFGSDLEQLIDKKKRTGPIGFSSAGKDAVSGNLTKLEPLKKNPRDYDVVLIGTPSWFGNMSPAVRTFITESDLSGRIVGVFGTTHLTGIENALKQAAELIRKDNPESIPTLPLRQRDLKEDELSRKINDFYNHIVALSR